MANLIKVWFRDLPNCILNCVEPIVIDKAVEVCCIFWKCSDNGSCRKSWTWIVVVSDFLSTRIQYIAMGNFQSKVLKNAAKVRIFLFCGDEIFQHTQERQECLLSSLLRGGRGSGGYTQLCPVRGFQCWQNSTQIWVAVWNSNSILP
jgi:hypothetical protein